MTHFTGTELRLWSESGPGPDRERVVAHVGACAQCAAAYAEAIRAHSFSPEQAAAADAADVAEFATVGYKVAAPRRAVLSFPAPARRSLVSLAAAAVLILALAVPYVMRVMRVRSVGDDSALRGGSIQALGPIGTIQSGTEFAWTMRAPAARYRVDVGDATGVLFSTTTEDTRTQISPADWGKLTPGVDYWWTVTAFDGNKREIGSTGRQAFRIRSR